ncbi:putative p-loop containing nucleoside triphosphate hydrolase protein [Venturia nashicola]|uniref:Putative p-loop containing nucleoside triphosphate hydrolase protein n=1 Tax=Venturia nashicola TaxID=86259 RepID=A0A4Z1PIW5_9PEZI|nr:putative p-loop containing nucleoside triphosphate hydrolase protein [Venturia nashicola]
MCRASSHDAFKKKKHQLRKPLVPSPEQQAIAKLSQTQNVVVSARPGSGKTATAEAIVAANPDLRIAVITYSKSLQLETARRLDDYPSCDVYTFHAMAGKLFPSAAPVQNDSILRKLRKTKVPPSWNGDLYNLIILDELQDCTDDLFWLVHAFVSAVTRAAGGKAPQIVCLGDERQAIYQFRGSDARFLSLSPSVMDVISPYPWSHLPLSKSFRLSHQTSDFVNKVFLNGEQYITGSHDGPKPIYMHGDMDGRVWAMADKLVPLIEKYGPECTAIIAPHIKSNGPLTILTNILSEHYKLPIAVSISDEVTLQDEVISGKICVTTYHQFKGSERDLVIVCGVDASYFTYLARDLPDDSCPNSTFVALTRARQQLVVLHHSAQPPMPFIDVQQLHQTANVIDLTYTGLQEPNPVGRPIQLGLRLNKNTFASEMVRHIPIESLDEICETYLVIKILAPPLPERQHINAPDKVLTRETEQHYEAVSDLNGLAVVAAYELSLLGTLTTLGHSPRKSIPAVPEEIDALAAWLCEEACGYEAVVSGYKPRKIQMHGHKFDWLGPYLSAARERLVEQFVDTKHLKFEVELKERDFLVEETTTGQVQTTCLSGRADIVQYDKMLKSNRKSATSSIDLHDQPGVSIWEIKFASQLSPEHAIQACVYAYLWCRRTKSSSPPRIILFNVRDGEKWEIKPLGGIEGLGTVVKETLRARYTSRGEPSTDEFLKKCRKTSAEVEKK